MSKSVQDYIADLEWDTPAEDKMEAISQLTQLEDQELPLLIQPLTKGHWDGAAEVIRQIGYPRVNSILPQLFVWLQDLNWPGAFEIGEFLCDIGEPLIPGLKLVIADNYSSDSEWVAHVLHCIISRWPTELVSRLEAELRMLAQGNSISVDLDAISILYKHGLEPAEALADLLEHKAQGAQSKIEQLILGNPDVDCGELKRRFSALMFQPDKIDELRNFHEENRSHFGVCNHIELLKDYLEDIETARKEISQSWE